jgi:Fe-Mn family superoxide dismutase
MTYSVKPLPFKEDALRGISENTNKWHYQAYYSRYVAERNRIERELKKINKKDNFPLWISLKKREAFLASVQSLHEIYWAILGGRGEPIKSLKIIQKIEEDFGSFDSWKEDFQTVAQGSSQWTLCVYQLTNKKIYNFSADNLIGGEFFTLIALDLAEHAYYYDYGPFKEKYILAYLNNIDWLKVEKRFSLIENLKN